jgi:hypothetical protein
MILGAGAFYYISSLQQLQRKQETLPSVAGANEEFRNGELDSKMKLIFQSVAPDFPCSAHLFNIMNFS